MALAALTIPAGAHGWETQPVFDRVREKFSSMASPTIRLAFRTRSRTAPATMPSGASAGTPSAGFEGIRR